jgi:2-polyprenyl-3-methyl-5-hydroxy-6-metoxy-1,4-benzoquinol methylase
MGDPLNEVVQEERFRYPVGERVLTTPEEFAAEFLPASYELESLGNRAKTTVELLLRHTPPSPLDVLDYGCSTGSIAYQIAKARPEWRVVGWEGDYSASEIATRFFTLPNLSYERKPYGEYQSFAVPRFNIVMFLEVIEHVANPGEILAAFHRVLRDDGLLVVSTPSSLGYSAVRTELWTAARLALRRATRERIAQQLNERSTDPTTNEGHVVAYSLSTLARMLRMHGFDVVSFVFARGAGGSIRRLIPETLIVLARKRT